MLRDITVKVNFNAEGKYYNMGRRRLIYSELSKPPELSKRQIEYFNRSINNVDASVSEYQKGCFVCLGSETIRVNDGKPSPNYHPLPLNFMALQQKGYVVHIKGINWRLTRKAFQAVGRDEEYEELPLKH